MSERFEKLRGLLREVEKVAPGPWEMSGISINDGSISIRARSVRCIIAYVTNAVSLGDFVAAAMRGSRDFGAPDTAKAQHDHANLIIEARNQLPEVLAALDAAEARVRRLDEALIAVRQELWVDECLARGRTDRPEGEWAKRPVIRTIDAALASKEEGGG